MNEACKKRQLLSPRDGDEGVGKDLVEGLPPIPRLPGLQSLPLRFTLSIGPGVPEPTWPFAGAADAVAPFLVSTIFFFFSSNAIMEITRGFLSEKEERQIE